MGFIDTSQTHAMPDVLHSVLERTGYFLPAILFTVVILFILYPDRLAFTPPHRAEVYYPKSITLPILGNTAAVISNGTKEQFHRFHETATESPNGVFRITTVGPRSLIMINRPEYIEYVQKTNFANYPKGSQFRERFEDLLGHNGIFVADGDTWLTQRKTASHIFSAFQFRNWIENVVHVELDFVTSVLDGISGPTGPGKLILPELFFRYTLSSFSKMAFSADLDCLNHDHTCLERPVEFSVAFDFVQGVINKRFVNPIYFITELFTKEGRECRKSVQQIRSFALGIITSRVAERKALNAGNAKAQAETEKRGLEKNGKDLLDLFMDHTLVEQDLLNVVLNFLIAGRDTTAQTLSWLFYELMAHPEHVQKIRDECREVLGSPADGVKLAYDQMKDMPYTQACISEALRLHPPVPKNGKRAIKDDVIIPQGANKDNLPPIKIYAGEMVGWSDWVMARLPAIWGEDCTEFKPSRFLETANGKLSYVPPGQWKGHWFNAGPRLCLGMNLAHFEALSFIAAVVPKYNFEWATREQGQTSEWPPAYANSVTHPIKDPYTCVVSRVADAH